MTTYSTQDIERRFPDGTIWRDRAGRYVVMLADGSMISGAELEHELMIANAPSTSPGAACTRCVEFEIALAQQREQIEQLSADVRRLEAVLQALLER